jgi:hypothetical protein
LAKRDKRQKASDIFREGNFAFTQKVSFDEAFPQIDKITVTVEEDGYGVGEWNRRRTYSKERLGEYIDCSNPTCYNGGFSIGSIIREMVREQKTEIETTKRCQGYEGSPKGRRKYRDCINNFKIRVSIEYKPAGEDKTTDNKNTDS